MVDPDLDRVRVYRSRDGAFDRPIELRAEAGDMLTTPLLAGFEAALAKIFAG